MGVEPATSAHRPETSELERVIGPLVTEVKLLRE